MLAAVLALGAPVTASATAPPHWTTVAHTRVSGHHRKGSVAATVKAPEGLRLEITTGASAIFGGYEVTCRSHDQGSSVEGGFRIVRKMSTDIRLPIGVKHSTSCSMEANASEKHAGIFTLTLQKLT